MAKDTPPGEAEASLDKLKQESQALKERIEELRRKTEMPLNSSLGDPAIDASNADGHNDVADEED
jgi:cell division protein FtsB